MALYNNLLRKINEEAPKDEDKKHYQFFLNFIRIIVHVIFVNNAPNPTKVNLKASGG